MNICHELQNYLNQKPIKRKISDYFIKFIYQIYLIQDNLSIFCTRSNKNVITLIVFTGFTDMS